MKHNIGSVVTNKPEIYKLVDAVEKVEKGEWVLAPFQRPDVWKLKQQKALLQSLISGIPIGNFILKEYNNIKQEVRNVPGIDYGHKRNIKAIIIDGQQRLSFLTWLKKKMLDESFSHGPEHLFYYNLLTGEITNSEKRKKLIFFLKNDDSKYVIAKNLDKAINEFKIQFRLDVKSSEISIDDKDSKTYWDDNDYLDEKEVIINNFFDSKYPAKVGNSISKWEEKDFENKIKFLEAKDSARLAYENLISIFNEERIIVVKANKNCDEEFGFKLYEVVNKSGIKLKGIDYIDGALYQICPNLFEEVNKARRKLSKIPFYMPGNISFEEKDLYKSIFSRANFSRCIIDELYNTPNPEERENENSELKKLMKFGKAVDIKGNKLDSTNVLDAFNKVYDSFKTIKSILQIDLKFGNLKGVNPTFMISANALFRAIKKSDINQIQKGKFIRWFILFHINEKPYLGGQDKKILDDCNAARNKDFEGLEKNLCNNLKVDNINNIMFSKKTYINHDGKNITSFEKISKNTESFLEKIHKFIAICEHARDWRLGDPINTYPTGHIDAHHIFPKNLWAKKISPEERRRRDSVVNKVHIHYNTNRHGDFKKEPINYLQKYLNRSEDDFRKQHIPINKKLWAWTKYDQFILERIKLLSDAGNKLLDKLNTGEWILKDSKTDCENIDEIKKTSNDEGWIIEFKPSFRLFDSKLNDKYSCVVFKEICALLNTKGGDLWIGIADNGNRIGLNQELNKIKEKLKNENKDHSDRSARDKFYNDFTNKLKSQLPKDEIIDNIYYHFIECNEKYFFKVQVRASINENIPLKKYYTFTNGNAQLKHENKVVVRIGDQSVFK